MRLQRAPTPPVATVEALDLPGPAGPIPCRAYTPSEPGPRPLIVFLHGGGWTAGDLDTHDAVCRRLCAAAGAVVLALGYRLAPEHPFPAAWDDAWAALACAAENAGSLGADPARLVLAGDSAGATLAAACAARARDEGGPCVALLLLICPILDIAGESASRRAFARGWFVDAAAIAQDLAWTLPPGADPADPRVSPVRAPSLAGLPPTLVHVAEYDPFRDEGLAYAAALREAGGAAQATTHPGMMHFFHALPRSIPYAADALERIGREVRRMLE